jgi:hypothetical protein
VMVYTCNPSIRENEGRRVVSSKPA